MSRSVQRVSLACARQRCTMACVCAETEQDSDRIESPAQSGELLSSLCAVPDERRGGPANVPHRGTNAEVSWQGREGLRWAEQGHAEQRSKGRHRRGSLSPSPITSTASHHDDDGVAAADIFARVACPSNSVGGTGPGELESHRTSIFGICPLTAAGTGTLDHHYVQRAD